VPIFHALDQAFVYFHRNGLMKHVHFDDQPQLAAASEDRALKAFHYSTRHFDPRSRLEARLRDERQAGRDQMKNAGQIALQLVLSMNRNAA
jgi:hypothetical protein